jgi:UDP-N-acetylmuramyl pentapeptide phosphotransferase/UDP-N-acetylglucosamine-1-phosphate transferase
MDPRWTVVLGGLMIVAAMIGATVVWLSGLPGAAKTVLLVVALLAAIAGWIFTFRDLSRPRRRR